MVILVSGSYRHEYGYNETFYGLTNIRLDVEPKNTTTTSASTTTTTTTTTLSTTSMRTITSRVGEQTVDITGYAWALSATVSTVILALVLILQRRRTSNNNIPEDYDYYWVNAYRVIKRVSIGLLIIGLVLTISEATRFYYVYCYTVSRGLPSYRCEDILTLQTLTFGVGLIVFPALLIIAAKLTKNIANVSA